MNLEMKIFSKETGKFYGLYLLEKGGQSNYMKTIKAQLKKPIINN